VQVIQLIREGEYRRTPPSLVESPPIHHAPVYWVRKRKNRRGKERLVWDQLDRMRLKYGFWIIITGFGLVAFITVVSIFTWSDVTNVATVVGAVSSLVGTVVGAFFGVQFGSAGKERVEAARDRSQEMAEAALSMLPPEAANRLRSEMDRLRGSSPPQ
jgi:hypothetical protein